jgi:hypothetical protein
MTDANIMGHEMLILSKHLISLPFFFSEFLVVHAIVLSLCLYLCNYVSGLFLYYLTFLLMWVPYSKLSRRHEINKKIHMSLASMLPCDHDRMLVGFTSVQSSLKL